MAVIYEKKEVTLELPTKVYLPSNIALCKNEELRKIIENETGVSVHAMSGPIEGNKKCKSYLATEMFELRNYTDDDFTKYIVKQVKSHIVGRGLKEVHIWQITTTGISIDPNTHGPVTKLLIRIAE